MSKLITAHELQFKPLIELRARYRAAHDDLFRSELDTPERRIALASLENISRAIAAFYAPFP